MSSSTPSQVDFKDIKDQKSLNSAINNAHAEGVSYQKSLQKKLDGKSRETFDSGADLVPAITGMSGLPLVGGAATALGNMLNNLQSLLSPIVQSQKFLKDLEVEGQRELFTRFKRELGDISRLGETALNKTTESFRLSRRNIAKDFAATADDLEQRKPELVLDIELGDGSIQKVNLLKVSMETLQKAQDEYFSYNLNNMETYGTMFAQHLVGQETEIARFTTGFNFTTEQTMTFVKRQLDLTGKAGLDMLDDLQTYSTAVADATGVPFKVISKTTAKIIEDVENFGNVTVEEATRIAGALNSTGLSFEKFSGMVGNFQSFDSAAGAVSNLTAVFGVQLDTMDLMMKANEDQEGFLHTLRDSFLDQGMAVEDLNLSQKKLLASQLQMGVSDVERFFREGLMPDQDVLEEATDTADAEEAIQRLNKSFETMMDNGKSVNEVMAAGLKESLMEPLAESLVDAGTRLSEMGTYYQDTVLAINQKIQETLKQKELVGAIDEVASTLSPEAAAGALSKSVPFRDSLVQTTLDGMATSLDALVKAGQIDATTATEFNNLFSEFIGTNKMGTSKLANISTTLTNTASDLKNLADAIAVGDYSKIPGIASDVKNYLDNLSSNANGALQDYKAGLEQLIKDFNNKPPPPTTVTVNPGTVVITVDNNEIAKATVNFASEYESVGGSGTVTKTGGK